MCCFSCFLSVTCPVSRIHFCVHVIKQNSILATICMIQQRHKQEKMTLWLKLQVVVVVFEIAHFVHFFFHHKNMISFSPTLNLPHWINRERTCLFLLRVLSVPCLLLIKCPSVLSAPPQFICYVNFFKLL